MDTVRCDCPRFTPLANGSKLKQTSTLYQKYSLPTSKPHDLLTLNPVSLTHWRKPIGPFDLRGIAAQVLNVTGTTAQKDRIPATFA